MNEDGSEQVNVRESDSLAVEATRFDQFQHFIEVCCLQLWQSTKQLKGSGPLSDGAKGKLSNNEGVYHDPLCDEKLHQHLVTGTEMIYPDRRIREDQSEEERRRGTDLMAGEEPPSKASLRALSRSMRDLSASLTRADFSATPVYSCAIRTRSSSSVTVVRMLSPASILAPVDADSYARRERFRCAQDAVRSADGFVITRSEMRELETKVRVGPGCWGSVEACDHREHIFIAEGVSACMANARWSLRSSV